jgi:hypothetical protein
MDKRQAGKVSRGLRSGGMWPATSGPIASEHSAPVDVIQRTDYGAAAAIQDLGIDHRSRDVRMTQKLLDGADVSKPLLACFCVEAGTLP